MPRQHLGHRIEQGGGDGGAGRIAEFAEVDGQIGEAGAIQLEPLTPLTSSDWENHLSSLRKSYSKWQFMEMPA